ncbi:hypothetical protein AVEN_38828-1 [Araneus ventricosus]|uniref:Uncharacterized protein n=1 Tax=Araneus ventricosus TaxID=182803 RepID=A0A4Y2K2B2_ARAVE|nr:hypothetical protein AVEN_38828-1 [Araneus ventricosus]
MFKLLRQHNAHLDLFAEHHVSHGVAKGGRRWYVVRKCVVQPVNVFEGSHKPAAEVSPARKSTLSQDQVNVGGHFGNHRIPSFTPHLSGQVPLHH